MSKPKSKLEDIFAAVIAILILIGLLLGIFGIKYVWLNYTPCSFHSVKDAPVRCIK